MMSGILVFLVIICVIFTNAHGDLSDFYRAQKRSFALSGNGSCGECGLSFGTKNVPFIINGVRVMITKEYPWMVALMLTGTNEFFCGGAIISDTLILTAAHCVVSDGNTFDPQRVTIGFLRPPAALQLDVKPEGKVAKIIIQPKHHDIALIRLEQPLTCDEYMNPICLPHKDWQLRVDDVLGITGWGTTSGHNIAVAPDLRSANIKVVNKEDCRKIGFTDMESIVCLKGDGGTGPCFGDSGGSMFKEIEGKYYTFGVASVHSSDHCDTNEVFVYTCIFPHLNWIHKEMSSVKTLKAKGSIRKKLRGSHRSSSSRRPAGYWSLSGCSGGYGIGCPRKIEITRKIFITG